MPQSNEMNIAKAKSLLERIAKIGVGNEGGGDVEHQSGGFGYTDEVIPADDSFYLPSNILTEDNCRKRGKKCKATHKENVTTKEAYSTGLTVMSQIGGDK